MSPEWNCVTPRVSLSERVVTCRDADHRNNPDGVDQIGCRFFDRHAKSSAPRAVFNEGSRMVFQHLAIDAEWTHKCITCYVPARLIRPMRAQSETGEALRRIKLFNHEFEDNAVPMWVFDTETLAFLSVNSAAIRKYGYSQEEFLSMTILDIRPAEDVIPLLQQELRDGRHNSNGELWTHRKKDGTKISVRIISRETEFDGRPAELVIAQDVTR
jgi:PAS domain S-box-containing protein